MTNLKIGATAWTDSRSDIIQNIKSVISSGFRYIELVLGTPEIVTLQHMRALSDLCRAGQVHISFHSPVDIVKLTGLGQSNFSELERAEDLRRAFKVINLAAEMRLGAPITFHADLFDRSLFNLEDGLFQLSGTEPNETFYSFIDKKNGRPIGVIGETEKVEIPIQASDKQGSLVWISNPDGDSLTNEITGGRIPLQDTDSSGTPKVQRIMFSDYRQQIIKQGSKKQADKIALELFKNQQLARLSLGFLGIRERERLIKLNSERLERLRETYQYYNKLSMNLSSPDRWRLERIVTDSLESLGISVPGRLETASSLIGFEIEKTQREIAESIQSSSLERKQIKDIVETLKNARTTYDLALNRASTSFARLGMQTLYCSKGCQGPLFISIENMFPPRYASLADEIIELISLSRDKMAYSLKKEGYSGTQAEELAHIHIGATLDPAHLYMFYAFFRGNFEDKRGYFNSWFLKQCSKLLQSKCVSVIHFSDNDGFSDGHGPLGSGSIPFRQLLKIIEQSGFRGPLILETGSQKHLDNLKYLGLIPPSVNLAESVDTVLRTHLDVNRDFKNSPFEGNFWGVDWE